MTLETETAPPAVGSSGKEGDTATTQSHNNTSESRQSNGGLGKCRVSHGGRISHQGREGWGRCFNCPAYMSLIQNFKGEADDFSMVLRTTSDQREAKDQYKKFNQKLKHYVIQEFHDPENIIVLVWDSKYPLTMLYTSRPTALYTQDYMDSLMVMIQTEEIKHYVKKRSKLKQNTIRLYRLIWRQFLPALHS